MYASLAIHRKSIISKGVNMASTYVPGQRLGIVAILQAFKVVARLVAEFGPRIRAAFPEAEGLQSFLNALEAAAALLLVAQGEFDAANAPEGSSDGIDWANLPGNLNGA